MSRRKHPNNAYKQGIFIANNKDKCLNTTCVYRSSYELHLMQMLDQSKNVQKWGSEKLIINYISPFDKSKHRYYPDFVVVLNDNSKYIIEIKPKNQTKPPKNSRNKKPQTLLYEQTMYYLNVAKWSAAKKYCDRNGYKFLLLDESHLFAF